MRIVELLLVGLCNVLYICRTKKSKKNSQKVSDEFVDDIYLSDDAMWNHQENETSDEFVNQSPLNCVLQTCGSGSAPSALQSNSKPTSGWIDPFDDLLLNEHQKLNNKPKSSDQLHADVTSQHFKKQSVQLDDNDSNAEHSETTCTDSLHPSSGDSVHLPSIQSQHLAKKSSFSQFKSNTPNIPLPSIKLPVDIYAPKKIKSK